MIPGGFSEEGEMPQETAEREVLEETGILVQAKDLVAVRFTTQEIWLKRPKNSFDRCYVLRRYA